MPADARVLPSGGLLVDESLLTGESLPVEKRADDELKSGTLLVRGVHDRGWRERRPRPRAG